MSVLMHQQAFAAIIEKVLNQVLHLNLNDDSALEQLAQQTLTVNISELGFPLSLTVENKKILVTGLIDRSDCILKASVASLIELKNNQQLTELIKQDKLDITGDIKVAQKFAALFGNITIDWQSEIAKHIGDIPTYKLDRFRQWLAGKFTFAASQIQADASEYLVHEQRLVVTKSQIDSFNQQVTQLSSELESLNKRVIQLAELANQ